VKKVYYLYFLNLFSLHEVAVPFYYNNNNNNNNNNNTNNSNNNNNNISKAPFPNGPMKLTNHLN